MVENPLANILESIAFEGAAISNILNAEGDGIKAAIKKLNNSEASIEELKELNQSVRLTIESATSLEEILHAKLVTIVKVMEQE